MRAFRRGDNAVPAGPDQRPVDSRRDDVLLMLPEADVA